MTARLYAEIAETEAFMDVIEAMGESPDPFARAWVRPFMPGGDLMDGIKAYESMPIGRLHFTVRDGEELQGSYGGKSLPAFTFAGRRAKELQDLWRFKEARDADALAEMEEAAKRRAEQREQARLERFEAIRNKPAAPSAPRNFAFRQYLAS